METKKRITGSSIGMFDLFKGLAMIYIVLFHSFIDFIGGNENLQKLFIPCFVLDAPMMVAFFLASGFGFRKRPLKKCIGQQTGFILKPYLYTTLGVIVLLYCTRFISVRPIKIAFIQMWPVIGGFLLAIPQNMEINGVMFCFVGSMWFVIALFIAWILLDFVMVTLPEKIHTVAVIGVVCIGWWIGAGRITPYCISQGMIATGYLYGGFKLKKGKFLSGKKSWKWWFVVAFVYICTLAAAIKNNYYADGMADGAWNLGPISIFMDGLLGVAILMIVLPMNRYSNWFTNALSAIGRDSMYICAIHTVEIYGIPWYLLSEKLALSPVLDCTMIFVLRWIFIFVAVKLIKAINKKRSHYRLKTETQ